MIIDRYKHIALVVLSLLLQISSPLFAHQKKQSITRIIFNERTASIEIIHRFSIHDAEHACKLLYGSSVDILGNKISQKQFANYVKQNFTLELLNGISLSLTSVGFEITDRYIWIYQETPLLDGIEGFQINHTALTEIWPEQVNLVNIERNKKVNSLIFKDSTGGQQISFN